MVAACCVTPGDVGLQSSGGSASASAAGGLGAVNITAGACRGAEYGVRGTGAGEGRGGASRPVSADPRRVHMSPRHAPAPLFILFFSFVFSLCSKYELKPPFRFLGELMKPGLRYHDRPSDKICYSFIVRCDLYFWMFPIFFSQLSVNGA